MRGRLQRIKDIEFIRGDFYSLVFILVFMIAFRWENRFTPETFTHIRHHRFNKKYLANGLAVTASEHHKDAKMEGDALHYHFLALPGSFNGMS